jgi:hypothetical protein
VQRMTYASAREGVLGFERGSLNKESSRLPATQGAASLCEGSETKTRWSPRVPAISWSTALALDGALPIRRVIAPTSQ